MISESRLPQLADISRSSSAIGEFGKVGSSTNVYTSIPTRVTMNKHYNDLDKSSYVTQSTHLIFMNLTYSGSDISVEVGDILTYGDGSKYRIKYPDKSPGGKEDHHYQIYAVSVS